MLIIKAFEKKLKPESRRKAFHMGMGVVMLTLPYLFTNFVSVVVLAIVAICSSREVSDAMIYSKPFVFTFKVKPN